MRTPPAIPLPRNTSCCSRFRADFPSLTIIRKTRRAPKKGRPTKNLTYANMEKYMSVFQNADELLAQFGKV